MVRWGNRLLYKLDDWRLGASPPQHYSGPSANPSTHSAETDIPGARWMAKLAKLVIWELSGWTMTQYIKCRVVEEDVRYQSSSSTYRH